MRIVVIGGYGNFGARICRALSADAALAVIAAGRHPAGAPPDFARLRIEARALDITQPRWHEVLRDWSPALVIHCAGPFQGQDYGVARAVLAMGAHYIDLSDGRDFVAGFSQAVNDDAQRASRLAISGASTLPGLSSAVADAYLHRFARLRSIESIIAPGQHAPRGLATLRAVLSYAGRPFPVWRDGRWQSAHGWMQLKRVDLPRLGSRLSALCDVPDLALFPLRYRGVEEVIFRAALEVPVQHRALAVIGWLQRAGLPVPVARLAALMARTAGWFDAWGGRDGGMSVTLAGEGADGSPLRLRWSLRAPDNHGPEIPCMPAVLLAQKIASGEMTVTGAMPCMGLLTLDEFAPQFAKWDIDAHVEENFQVVRQG